jgi:hypothetical protein
MNTTTSKQEEKKSPIVQPAVRALQKNLRKNDVARDYVSQGHATSSEEDSDEEEVQEVRIMAPQRRKKQSLDFLLQELVNQQKLYISSQRKVMKLQTEVDTEEVKTRYLKLDLNTAQVLADERKSKLYETKCKLTRAQIEVWVSRVTFVLLFLVYMYRMLF